MHVRNFDIDFTNRAKVSQIFVESVGNFMVVGEECKPRKQSWAR